MRPTSKILHGDCLEVLPSFADNHFDSIVTDPPYGLKFQSKEWDYDVPSVEVWRECLRVLKPGGHLLSFASTRTQHRACTNIEDADFEVRDVIAWVYGTGFPKNRKLPDGWGTALKPAMELITLARKPFKGTVAANVLEHGTGGINIDACRIHSGPSSGSMSKGRFPANVIFDEEAAAVLDEQSGDRSSPWIGNPNKGKKGGVMFGGKSSNPADLSKPEYRDSGGASRFFYCSKASKKDRTENGTVENNHPTVKPTDLMRHLCRLVTPVNGVVLDPFAGSGTTGKAAVLDGFSFVGIELEAEYIGAAQTRSRVGGEG